MNSIKYYNFTSDSCQKSENSQREKKTLNNSFHLGAWFKYHMWFWDLLRGLKPKNALNPHVKYDYLGMKFTGKIPSFVLGSRTVVVLAPSSFYSPLEDASGRISNSRVKRSKIV